MRRPLFMVCLCLVTIAAVRLWLYDSSDTGGGRETSSVTTDGEIITVTGRVHRKDAQSFVLSDVASLRQNIPIDEKLICEYEYSASIPLGCVITIQGTFRSFSEATNPGEFDVADYYASLGIGGKLADVTVLEKSVEYSLWRETVYELREYFSQRLYTVFPQKEASVLVAMLLGDKTHLDSGIKKLYRENGIIHILSISGLHITLIGMSIYQVLRRCGVPVWIAAVCGGSILCLYGVMTGLSISACRAIGMYLIRMLAEVTGRTYDILTALGVMAVIMVWQNPMNLKNAGFALSFGSVLGIGWFYPSLVSEERTEPPKRYESLKWKRILRGMLQEGKKRLVQSILAGGSITLFTLPIQLWFYYEIPVYSVFLNLLVLPFMSLVLMTGLLVMLVPGSGIVGTGTCLILQGYEWLCNCFEGFPNHTWNPGKPEIWQVAVYYMMLLVVVLLKKSKRQIEGTGGRWRNIATPILLTASVIILTLKIRIGTTITFLDVGQGDCIVVEAASGEVFMFDCGSTGRKSVGEYVLLPFLKYKGIRHIDAIFVSHPDQDHCSGIEELFAIKEEEGITVAQLILPAIAQKMRKEEMSSLLQAVKLSEALPAYDMKAENQEGKVTISYISAGDSFSVAGASFLCLHPPKGYESEDSNAYSQCFYMEVSRGEKWLDGLLKEPGNATFSMLLTGDVEGEGEELLLQELVHRGISDIMVLKVAHHGSRYSGSAEFLNTVKPQFAVISCGENNSYGHPHEETLARLSDCGAVILTTPEYGAITVEVGEKLSVYGFTR